MVIEKSLLIHWWKNYLKIPYSESELNAFEEIIDSYGIDMVFHAAVHSYMVYDETPKKFLFSIRKNTVENLFAELPPTDNMPKAVKEIYERKKSEFLNIISDSYVNS